jgi:hypothetical protein
MFSFLPQNVENDFISSGAMYSIVPQNEKAL